jgi:hypothetical protein
LATRARARGRVRARGGKGKEVKTVLAVGGWEETGRGKREDCVED